jgi:uncharacterized protein YcfJ
MKKAFVSTCLSLSLLTGTATMTFAHEPVRSSYVQKQKKKQKRDTIKRVGVGGAGGAVVGGLLGGGKGAAIGAAAGAGTGYVYDKHKKKKGQ